MEHWASADELWEAATQGLARQREAKRHAEEAHPKMLVLDLDRCLAELTNEVSIME
jgi:hypothetical protein